MERKYIQVKVMGSHIPRRCRVPKRYSFNLAEIDSLEQFDLSAMTEKAKAELVKFSNVRSCYIATFNARYDDYNGNPENAMVFTEIMALTSHQVAL